MLSLDCLSLRRGAALSRLGRAFLSFGLSAVGFRGLRIGRGARAVCLDRTGSGLLAKLSGLLTTTLVTPTARGASGDGDEQ
jgi:hypothetical protein